mmetsp:Transcript_10349/g.11805  ORF Transcript_10349/g.11805 Transcript_10349/m.11805 type:complete len:89 (+) Transcript_10349:883-1149(+)
MTTFWRLTPTNYFYYFKQSVSGPLIFTSFTLSPGFTKYTQYYTYSAPVAARNLDSEIKTSTKTTTQKNNEDSYFGFYMLSQLGGLYVF